MSPVSLCQLTAVAICKNKKNVIVSVVLVSGQHSKVLLFSVADPGGEGGHGPPSVPDKDYLLCTSWHFLVKKKTF